jgi:RNA polymerase sigma-70 factor (ECF subfamily)
MEESLAKLEWFKAVILPHRAALRAHLRQRRDLDDLVSEVMTRAWATQDWRQIDRGKSYVFMIARNLVIDLARREKIVSFETASELDLLQSDGDFELQLSARDQLRRLQAIIEQLPPQCRRAFMLRRIEEKSFADIAAEMDLSVSTVEKHLAKAIRLLAQALADDGENGFVRKRAPQLVDGPDRREERGATRQIHP